MCLVSICCCAMFMCRGAHHRNRLSKLVAAGCRAPDSPLGGNPVFKGGVGYPLRRVVGEAGEVGVLPPHMNPIWGFMAAWASIWSPAGATVRPIGAHAAMLSSAAGKGLASGPAGETTVGPVGGPMGGLVGGQAGEPMVGLVGRPTGGPTFGPIVGPVGGPMGVLVGRLKVGPAGGTTVGPLGEPIVGVVGKPKGWPTFGPVGGLMGGQAGGPVGGPLHWFPRGPL